MSEPISDIVKALTPWPMTDFAFLSVVIAATTIAIIKGVRDRRNGVTIIEIPTYLTQGPVAETMERLAEMATETRRIRELLEDIHNDREIAKMIQSYSRGQPMIPPRKR